MTQNEHVYVICCRPKVAGDVISGEDVKTVDGSAVLNFEVASLSSFMTAAAADNDAGVLDRPARELSDAGCGCW